MKDLQNELLDKNYEEVLIILTDLCKSDFKLITKGNQNYSLKEKILEFGKIDENTIVNFTCEYNEIQEKLENYWTIVNKKLSELK